MTVNVYIRVISSSLKPGAFFSKVPKLFGWHSFLCIFKTKVFRVTELSYFTFYSLYSTWKDQLYRISESEFKEWLFGPVKFSGLLRNARQVSIVLILEVIASDWGDYMETADEKVRAHVMAQIEGYFERMGGVCGKIKLQLPVWLYFMGKSRCIRVLVMQTTLSNSWEYINADNTNCLKDHFEGIYPFCVHSFAH